MKKETDLITLGHKIAYHQDVVNPPIFRASTILFNTLADFEMCERGEWPYPTYGRYGTPSTVTFEQACAKLEGADHSIVHSSGLAAIVTTLVTFAGAGNHLLIADNVYGPMRRFCEHELKRMGVQVTYYDPTIGAGIADLIQDNTKLVYCESPGSLTFEMQDIPAIVAAAKKRGVVVAADNTWATPIYFRAFEHGIDISIHSATKYIAGHSDLVMGILSCKEAHYKQLLRTQRNLGSSASAENCYLALRGMRTMAVRLKQHQENALNVATWLQTRPEVERLIYPALPGDAGHALWKRDMTGATGLFATLLKPCSHNALAAFLDGLELFGMGYSWGGFESLIIPFHPEKSRTATTWEHKGPNLRLHIGLENTDDIIRDLEKGFERMKGK